MSAPCLIVSLHDVSPLTAGACGLILDELQACGLRGAVSLLVIPNHHHKAPVAGNEGFRQWLGGRLAGGDEAALHGYVHLREARSGDRGLTALMTSRYTAGEGEFFDLGEGEAAALLLRGIEDLAWCGVRPAGFVAPAWLLGKEAAQAVAKAGFAYTTRLDCIEILRAKSCRVHSQSLVWSVRAAWRRLMSLAWNAALRSALARDPVLRLGIHPPDWQHPAIRKQILAIVRRELARRTPLTYEEWVTRQMS